MSEQPTIDPQIKPSVSFTEAATIVGVLGILGFGGYAFATRKVKANKEAIPIINELREVKHPTYLIEIIQDELDENYNPKERTLYSFLNVLPLKDLKMLQEEYGDMIESKAEEDYNLYLDEEGERASRKIKLAENRKAQAIKQAEEKRIRDLETEKQDKLRLAKELKEKEDELKLLKTLVRQLGDKKA